MHCETCWPEIVLNVHRRPHVEQGAADRDSARGASPAAKSIGLAFLASAFADPRIVSCYPTVAPTSLTIFSTTDASHPRRAARRSTFDAGTPSPRTMSAFRLAISADGFASFAGR